MKKAKKKNGGFSLVELIVVILIMAIIAVALAPQVMKWVGKSKESADISNYDSLVSNIQLALTDDATLTACGKKEYLITFDSTGVKIAKGPGTTGATGPGTTGATDDEAKKLGAGLDKISGYRFNDGLTSDSIKAKDGGPYTITLTGGKVIRTTPPVADEDE